MSSKMGFTLNQAVIDGAQKALDSGDASTMYQYMINNYADRYSMLADSVVGGTPSMMGIASMDYLNNAAYSKFGVEGAANNEDIKKGMAQGYIDMMKEELERSQKAGNGDSVSNFEMDYDKGYILHDKVFSENGLDITVWSMHAVKWLPKELRDTRWLDSLDATHTGEILDSLMVSLNIFKDMYGIKSYYESQMEVRPLTKEEFNEYNEVVDWIQRSVRTVDDLIEYFMGGGNTPSNTELGTDMSTFLAENGHLYSDTEEMYAKLPEDFEAWKKAKKEAADLSGVISEITKQVIDDLIDLNPWRSMYDRLMRAATFDNLPAPRDPIILDLNEDGISTIASGGKDGQKFDFNDDGLKTAAGWVAPTDGVLGIDQDGDGKLTSGKELIGDQTELKDGRIAAHGYEVIADLDSNGDGVINALDPDFHKLRVWVDKNSDGISQADELFTLTELGIIGLNLEHKMTSETLNGNNVLSHIGSYIKADGTTGLMGNVNFMPDDLYTEYVDKIPLTPEQAAVSKIGGIGRVRSLAEAITQSGKLQLQFEFYRSCETKAEQLAALDDLLLAWAETDPKYKEYTFDKLTDATFVAGSSNAIGSGGGATGGVTLEPDPLKERWIAAAAKIGVLNTFFNLDDRIFYKLPSQYVNKTWTNLAANTNMLDTIDRIYHQLTSNMYMELMVETRLSPYLHQITVTEAGLDFTKVITLFDQVAMTNARKAFVDLAEFITLFEDKTSVLDLVSVLDQYAQLGVLSDGINDWMKELSLEVDAVKKLGLIVSALDNNLVAGTTVNDIILGSIGGKQISAGRGNDIIIVNTSNNFVEAGAGNDTIYSGSGNNFLQGGTGSDTYVFSKGHGQDIVSDNGDGANGYSRNGAIETIKFTDVNFSEVKFARDGNNLIIFGYNGSDQVIIERILSHQNYRIDVFQFADRTVTFNELWANGLPLYSREGETSITGWAGANIITGNSENQVITTSNSNDVSHTGNGNNTVSAGGGNDVIYTGTGNNTVYAGAGNDTIYSGSGNNFLQGGTGSDTYVFSKGHGQDIVADNGDGANGYSRNGAIDTIKLTDVNFAEAKFGRDGNNLIIFGYNGSDQVIIEKILSHQNYRIDTFGFLDRTVTFNELWANGLPLYSREGETSITGWSGANIITGNSENQVITTSNSNDMIHTGNGNNTVNAGGGNDVIYTGTGNNTVYAGAGNDTIYSGSGDNFLQGGTGSDTYVFAKGHGQAIVADNGDGVNGYSRNGAMDTIKLTDVNFAEAKFARDGNNLIIFGYNGSDQITIEKILSDQNYRIDAFEFADHQITLNELLAMGLTTYSKEDETTVTGWTGGINQIVGNAIDQTITTGRYNDVIYTGGGNNTVYAGAGNDTIYSGSGNNFLQGGTGSDTYIFSKGHGQDIVSDNGDGANGYSRNGANETIKFTDVNFSEVKFARDGNNLIIFGYNGSDQITIEKILSHQNYRIDTFEFSDRTVTFNELWANGLPLYSREGETSITGWSGANIITGNSENQVITTSNSNDVIHTGNGNNTVNAGGGNDVIYTGAGNNTVYAGAGSDTIHSGSGNNFLQGGTGSDTYIFSKGHGQDIVSDNGDGANGYSRNGAIETIKFTDVNFAEVKFARDGNHLIIFGYNGSDKITVEYLFSHQNYRIDKFQFEDKTITYSELIKTSIPAFTAEDQASLLAAQAELEAARTLSQVMSPASYLMMDELFANTAPTVGLSPMNAMASNEAQADIAKEVQSLISAMASFGATEGSIQIEDQTYGYLTPITVPS